MVRRSRRGQIWSTDLIIGLLIFALIIVIFYFLLSSGDKEKIHTYSNEADVVAGRFIELGLVNPDTGEFNEELYVELTNMNYEEVREKLGVSGEFCLFIESTDTTPELIIINNQTGLGNSDFMISNLSCGTRV